MVTPEKGAHPEACGPDKHPNKDKRRVAERMCRTTCRLFEGEVFYIRNMRAILCVVLARMCLS